MRGSGVAGRLVQRPRVWKYRWLSDCRRLSGTPVLVQPVLFLGPGTIELGPGVEFGWPRSVGFFSGYGHVEASRPEASVVIAGGAQINNGSFIKSEGAGIRIGADALLGSQVTILDSDFHDLDPSRRRRGRGATAPVTLGRNVFVGDGVRILKGVTVGDDSVVGAGSVVSRSLPAGVVAAGSPARVVRALEDPVRAQLV